MKIKNFDLIVEEIKNLTAYTENNLFFIGLENVVRNDILTFVEEINQFILENLDLNLELSELFKLIDRLKSLNNNFQKKEQKINS